jgi:hypothetical protein
MDLQENTPPSELTAELTRPKSPSHSGTPTKTGCTTRSPRLTKPVFHTRPGSSFIESKPARSDKSTTGERAVGTPLHLADRD